MPFDTMEPSKTGLVLFDMLNSGFRERSEEVQRSKQPMVDNCVRLMNAARETGMPIFYPKADHRADSKDLERRYIDLAPDMKPWPNPENRYRPHSTITPIPRARMLSSSFVWKNAFQRCFGIT